MKLLNQGSCIQNLKYLWVNIVCFVLSCSYGCMDGKYSVFQDRGCLYNTTWIHIFKSISNTSVMHMYIQYKIRLSLASLYIYIICTKETPLNIFGISTLAPSLDVFLVFLLVNINSDILKHYKWVFLYLKWPNLFLEKILKGVYFV